MAIGTGTMEYCPYADFVNTLWLLESADLFLFRGETTALAAIEGITILGQRGLRNFAPQGNRIHRRMLGKAP